jgi:hypothetical protein
MVQLLWLRRLSAMVRCGSDCTGKEGILYLPPGDLRRRSEPIRLSGGPESLWGAFGYELCSSESSRLRVDEQRQRRWQFLVTPRRQSVPSCFDGFPLLTDPFLDLRRLSPTMTMHHVRQSTTSHCFVCGFISGFLS